MPDSLAPDSLNRDKAAAFDLLTTAVLTLDDSLCVSVMNPAAEDLFGTSAQRATGGPLTQFLYDDDDSTFNELLSLLAAQQAVTRRAAHFKLRDGTSITVDFSLSHEPIHGTTVVELQPLNRFLRINRDDQALASLKTAQELARGLAHEVKNPLGGLRGAAQLLEQELPDPALREYTGVIIDEADRLKDLVDRMLGPNRRLDLAPCNIHQILEHVVRLVEAEFPGRLRVERDYDPSVPEISGDQDQLIQAMLNVIRNAAQILESHRTSVADPHIQLKTRITRTFTIGDRLHRLVAQIDVIDNGPGISEDMLERLFFPMITSRPDGTGLGLAITQNIIGQHHGVIECESEPGRTCFSVFIPLETPTDD